MSARKEAYLGDGVYATYSGYDIKLDLRGQDDYTQIFLGPDEVRALVEFAVQCQLVTVNQVALKAAENPVTRYSGDGKGGEPVFCANCNHGASWHSWGDGPCNHDDCSCGQFEKET